MHYVVTLFGQLRSPYLHTVPREVHQPTSNLAYLHLRLLAHRGEEADSQAVATSTITRVSLGARLGDAALFEGAQKPVSHLNLNQSP